MFPKQRNHAFFVVHSHAAGAKDKQEVSFDTAELKHSSEFHVFAGFAAFDASEFLGTKGKKFSRLDRMGSYEVGDIQKLPPTFLPKTVESQANIPGHPRYSPWV